MIKKNEKNDHLNVESDRSQGFSRSGGSLSNGLEGGSEYGE